MSSAKYKKWSFCLKKSGKMLMLNARQQLSYTVEEVLKCYEKQRVWLFEIITDKCKV